MARHYKKAGNFAALLSSANSGRSFEEITLKTDAEYYESGTVVMKELDAQSDETGVYIRVNSTDLAGYASVDLAVVMTRTVATDGDEIALSVVRDAELKGFELDLPADLTVDDIASFAAAQGLIIR